MRVPSCAIVAILACGGCVGEAGEPPAEGPLTAALCGRPKLPDGVDLATVRWELVVPPAGNADQRQVIDTIVDLCDSIATLSHSAGRAAASRFRWGQISCSAPPTPRTGPRK